ncbi:adenine deaminase C-terminal domain-containing protein [Bacillus sp. S/N-304-OC-R1]|uniref:adenine deaminase C-terminal domain-containing protein n=1 Tax=Bacillus sp. S/N-304-OC-R1 TaxID=2758034 RepID=UPI001C8E880D|nr:adenine deaminase C-terminal domain-containing protein [Bacillus sp. S/N-304-OC-R1]MBY0122235.1 adenine deaminase [Bacillus sp. S/N-304-OC-R1]
MLEQRFRWKNKHLRDHVSVLDGKISPTLLLKNARYLNQAFRKWITANIWIYNDRIVYVGDNLPNNTNQCEVMDCDGYLLVPGYIEPHSHPFQLYNPHSFASYASQFGTTTLINDNMVLALQLDKKKAFSFIGEMRELPSSMYWWCRFDAQTEIQNEGEIFSHNNIKSWLEHDSVLQGGELTGWPKLLDGDDLILHWIQETKRLGKKIEGHFPGASEKTLAKLMLLGTDCDHEAMTGKDVYNRLMQGYTVSLRYSSIRPDLPVLLDEMHELGIDHYDKVVFTTDGSSPAFYEQGIIDGMIQIAIEKGVPIMDAYNMGTINIARHYNMEHLHGNIATGRIANINFLTDERNPTPVSVLAKGKWVKKDGEPLDVFGSISWEEEGFKPLQIDWDLDSDDLQYSMPFGIKMENTVIMKPYSIAIDVSGDELSTDHDECFFMLVDRHGKWRINTLLKGFATSLDGFASSFSNTGDFILIGKSKQDMLNAFNRMKEIGGGITVSEKGRIVQEIPLSIMGLMSNEKVESIIEKEKELRCYLREKGYKHADPIYSLLFFSSTHLPYIRVTQQGMYDVMNKTVLFPTIMR